MLAIYVYFTIPEGNLQTRIVFVIIIMFVVFFVIILFSATLPLPDVLTKTSMYRRIASKLRIFGIGANSVNSGGLRNLFIERCWDRLIDYPEKLLYGAGEGYYSRFPSALFTNNEIHSSIFGPLFYYGIIPCSIWFLWTAKQLKNIKPELWCAIIALIIESITLVNNRQPFFWMIFVLVGSELAKRIDNNLFISEFSC